MPTKLRRPTARSSGVQREPCADLTSRCTLDRTVLAGVAEATMAALVRAVIANLLVVSDTEGAPSIAKPAPGTGAPQP